MSLKNTNAFTQYESNVRSYCRSISATFTHSLDSFMYDDSGTEYVDFLSGAGALNFGHNNKRIKSSVTEYMNSNGIMFGLDLHTKAKREFILTFQKKILKPRELSYKIQFTSPTGTSVVESAIKLARKYTGRQNIVCFTNAFHGMTSGSLSLTGSKHHRQAISSGNVTRFPFDGYFGHGVDSVEYYRKLLTDPSSGVDLPAAIILETVQGEGGVNIASRKWLQDIRKLSRELDILLIVDDIQTGCGRCGQFFSFEDADIQPDIVCLSKSIGGIGLPFSVLLFNEKLDIWSAGEDNGTFRGNNLAFVASTEMINLYWSDDKFQKEIREKEMLIVDFFARIKKDYIGFVKDTRGRGLMQGVELSDPFYVSKVIEFCFENKLIIESCGPHDEVLKLMPALTIENKVLIDGLRILECAINKVFLEMNEQNRNVVNLD